MLETLRLEEIERRRRSLRTEPLVLSYRNSEAAVAEGANAGGALAELPGTPPGRVPASQAPHAASPGVTAEGAVATAGEFLQLLTELNERELAANAQPAPAAGPAPSLARLGPETETPVVDRPADPAGWDRIYEGSFLEAVLVTELSGEFPGPVLANVSVPFYSADRQRVLVPRGARVVGTVGAVSGADQERLAVAFHRILWPEGRSVSLEFNGLNQIGESALKDEVDRHYFSMVRRRRSRRHPVRAHRARIEPLRRGPGRFPGRSQSRAWGKCGADSRPLPQSPAHHHDSRGPPRAHLVHRRCSRAARTGADWRHPMTIKHAIAFSLSLALTGVFAIPPGASAQFDLDLQATEIGNQVQEILNRVTQYTSQLTQFTRLDCSAQGMAAGAEATPINEAAVVCDTLNMIGAFRDSYRQLLQAPTDLLKYPRAVSRLARCVGSRRYRHRGRYS